MTDINIKRVHLHCLNRAAFHFGVVTKIKFEGFLDGDLERGVGMCSYNVMCTSTASLRFLKITPSPLVAVYNRKALERDSLSAAPSCNTMFPGHQMVLARQNNQANLMHDFVPFQDCQKAQNLPDVTYSVLAFRDFGYTVTNVAGDRY